MRWDNLFDDLEGQLESELGVEEGEVRAEEERLRLARLALRDRLHRLAELPVADPDSGVRIALLDGTLITFRPRTFGRDWTSGDLVSESTRPAQAILPLAAISALVLSGTQVAASLADVPGVGSAPGLARRLGLAFVLRDLCRRRCTVELVTLDGRVGGTIDRVGSDHLDLAVHESGSSRRESAVSQYRVIPFARVILVRL